MKKIFICLFLITLCSVTVFFVGCNKKEDTSQILIKFDSNGGSQVANQVVNYGDKIIEPENCTKLGYELDGWYIGNEEWVFVGYTITEPITLTAKWTPIIYNIEYIDNGNLVSQNPNTYTIEDDYISLYEPTRFNQIFAGWFLDQEYLEPIQNIDCSVCKNLTLYAKWTDVFNISNNNDFIHFVQTPFLWKFTIELKTNLNLNNAKITPIGNISNRFNGIFNGNGFTISNFSVESESEYIGLFGYVENSIIKNLGLINQTINHISSERFYCGGLAGYVSQSSIIDNCFCENLNIDATASVSSKSPSVGGLIGYLSGYQSNEKIKNCYTTGIVKGNGSVGGLIGYISGYTIDTSVIIENCYSSCSTYSTRGFVGGLICSNSGPNITIKNCYSSGNLKADDGDYIYSQIAGIIRYSTMDTIVITNCYSLISRKIYLSENEKTYDYLYDKSYINLSNQIEILNGLSTIWDNEIWDFSSNTSPTLKTFNK